MREGGTGKKNRKKTRGPKKGALLKPKGRKGKRVKKRGGEKAQGKAEDTQHHSGGGQSRPGKLSLTTDFGKQRKRRVGTLL